MKRIFTSLLGLTALLLALPAQAEVQTVASKTDFENFFFKERTNEQCDTIYVKYTSGVLALNNGKNMPNAGKIYIIGVDDAETGVQSGLGWQWNLPLNTEADKLSIFFENLRVEVNGGRLANSKYLFQTKDTAYHYIDSLSFKNCEITNYNRALFRVQPAEKADGTKDAGDVNYLGMEGCTVHAGYLYKNDPMSLFRMDMRVGEMVFRNNLFYDLGYVHSLVQFATMTEEVGRADIDFTFENNLFIAWNSQNSLMMFDSYVGQMSTFHINNNIFIAPSWKDTYNNADMADSIIAATPDTLSKRSKHYIASIQYGVVECKNNVLIGYKTPRASLDADGEGAWLSADTVYITPEQAGFSWDIFTDWQNGDFSYLSGEKMATAGSDGGPIGPAQLVKYLEHPCYLTVTSATEGVSFEPAKGVYEKGEQVSVKAIERAGAIFQYWTVGGEQVSAANPYVFTITADVALVAVFEEKPVAEVNITLDAPEEVVMTIDPAQDVYYQGDSITVTFNTHGWADFKAWSDGVKEMNRGFRLTADINLTAAFEKSDRIAVWDFCQVTKGKQTLEDGVGANHFAAGDSAYIGALHTAYWTGDAYKDSATVMTRNNKFAGDIRLCAVRETPAERFAATPDYNYIELNVEGYKDIKVASAIGADAKGYKTQLMQYYDGTQWVTFASAQMDTIGVWYALEGSLPAAAIIDNVITVRWIGDTQSAVVAHPDNMATIDEVAEFTCTAGIIVKGTKTVTKPSNGYYVEAGEQITTGKQITSVAEIVMTYGGSESSTWGAGAANATLSANTDGLFEANTGGEGNNPKTEANKNPGSAGIPATGTFYKLSPAADGEVEIAVVLNSGKNFFVMENTTVLDEYNGITVSEKYQGTYKFAVKAGSDYYFFCTGSKLGFGGFIFTSATALDTQKAAEISFFAQNGDLFVNLPEATVVSVINLLGQTVRTLDGVAGENVISGLDGGIYLLRLGNDVVKIKL